MTEPLEDKEYRQVKIREIIEQELQDGEDLAQEARNQIAFLLVEKKGYDQSDVRRGISFEVTLGTETAWSSADFLVSVDGTPAMIIKCAAGSLDSRQRQVVAAARVIASPPLAVAVVADPAGAIVMDARTGKPVGEGFGAIPVKDQLRQIVAVSVGQALDPKRLDKEKRILLAFDAIKCCVPQGKDGGVQIGEPEKP